MSSETCHVRARGVSPSVHALLNVVHVDKWFERMRTCLPADVHQSKQSKTRLASQREVSLRHQVESGRNVYLWVFLNPYQFPYVVLEYSLENPDKLSVGASYSTSGASHSVTCHAYLVEGTAAAKACSKERIFRAISPADSCALNHLDNPHVLPTAAARHLAEKLRLLPAYKVCRIASHADVSRCYKLPILLNLPVFRAAVYAPSSTCVAAAETSKFT